MKGERNPTETLRPHVSDIQYDAFRGNKDAEQIISLYEMHRRCPSDPGAAGLCLAAFDTWLKSLGATR